MNRTFALPLIVSFCLITGLLLVHETSQAKSESQQEETQSLDPRESSNKPVFDVSSLPEEETDQAIIDGIDPGPAPGEYWERPPKPFAVGATSANFQWAAADGMDPEVMKSLANNQTMLDRLYDENHYISRRQLIYVPEDFSEVAQSLYHGEIDEISLPGFDGEEFPVVITQRDNMEGELPENGPLTGAWSGHLKDDPNVEVFGASFNNYWSIVYQQGGVRYQYENREENEWILVDIDVRGEDHFHSDGQGMQCIHDTLNAQQVTPNQE